MLGWTRATKAPKTMPVMARASTQGADWCGGVREQGDAEAEESVGAHFQHDRGQHDGSGGRGFDVRIGQPGVQWEQRNLDREGEEEGQEEQHFCLRA